MATKKMKRLRKDLVDIVMMFPFGAMGTIVGTHILPHVHAESNHNKPLSHGESRLFPSKEAWNNSTGKEKIEMIAFYTGGFTGLISEIGFYYHYKETNPAILAIPIATNLISAIYEFYKTRKKII